MICPYFLKEGNVTSCVIKERPDDIFSQCEGDMEKCLISLEDLKKFQMRRSQYES